MGKPSITELVSRAVKHSICLVNQAEHIERNKLELKLELLVLGNFKRNELALARTDYLPLTKEIRLSGDMFSELAPSQLELVIEGARADPAHIQVVEQVELSQNLINGFNQILSAGFPIKPEGCSAR